jgi:hypothetical protein
MAGPAMISLSAGLLRAGAGAEAQNPGSVRGEPFLPQLEASLVECEQA